MAVTYETLAGSGAAVLFVAASLPMLHKAAATRDLASYSGTNLATANLGNTLQWIYLLSLPMGPLWALHAFNTAVSATMLTLWLRHQRRDRDNTLTEPDQVMPHEHQAR